MTVRAFLRIVWAGRYYVLAAVFVALVGAGLYLQRQVAVFESSAVVQIISADTAATSSQPGTTLTVDPDVAVVTSSEVLDLAAQELGDGTTAAELRGSVQAFFNADELRTEVVAQASEPTVAVDRANAVAGAYVATLPQVLQGQVDALEQRREALRGQLSGVEAQLRQNVNDPLAAAERDTIVEQYQAISAQRSTFESIVNPAQVLTPATRATARGMPVVLVVGVAALAGLLAGVGLAFARRGLDVRVRSSTEAASLTKSPVLAELYDVPAADKEFRRTDNLPVTSRHATPFTESIRELRTAVRVALGDASHTVVVVTAADPFAPRAFITANLAASFALSGRRTVVVSGDMRRPQVAELVHVPATSRRESEEALGTRVPNLRYLAIHDDSMDPADYLATVHVRRLVERLRSDSAVVIVDAPPVLAAADATILGGYADGVVLVASAGRTDRAVLEEAAERLRTGHVPLLGVALAGVKGNRRMLYASTYGTHEAVGNSGSADDPATERDQTAQTRSPQRGASSFMNRRSAPEKEPAPTTPVLDAEPDRSARDREAHAETTAAPDRAPDRPVAEQEGPKTPRLAPEWPKIPPAAEPERLEEPDEPVEASTRRRPFRW